MPHAEATPSGAAPDADNHEATPARDECIFYHVIDLPDEAATPGSWDFRDTEVEYHGGFEFAGKRVLEVGTATGSHAFWMERQGADVLPYDLTPRHSWDLLPAPVQDSRQVDMRMRKLIGEINAGFRYCRDRLGSKLSLHGGTAYDIPTALGEFDVIVFASVLLHLRDPMGALQRAACRAKTIIICDRYWPSLDNARPDAQFAPRLGDELPWGGWTWWYVSPKAYEAMLQLLGFTSFRTTVSGHLHIPSRDRIPLYTLIASRS
ncbi:class I SAM-dependent methyltransferase [Plastoroseomonas hellenica]|uniref:class I SAM-dependent methyltransferase n=1 Tax=Plastoroseomonas hellenica TaxID=2687306 RepID=UPI001BA8F4D0|nr:methyltransferase domain-containing protein [Plastoroseomonas hellenica]MBR0645969.1 methyltransferase domain-containing protein [Plastoroseomonas hellenica]